MSVQGAGQAQAGPCSEAKIPVAGLLALLLSSQFPMFGLFAIGIDFPRVAAAFPAEPHAAIMAQLIGGLSGLCFALSSLFVGKLVERIGYGSVYVWGLAGFAFIGVIPAMLDSLPLILATRCLLGVCIAAVTTAGMSGIGRLPVGNRTRMFGRHALAGSVGSTICFPLVGVLAELDWRYPFLLHLAALAVIPLALALPRQALAGSLIEAGARTPRGLGAPVPLLLMAAFVGLAMFAGPMFTPFYLQSLGVTDPTLAALPLSAMSITGLVVASIYNRLHGHFGTKALFGCTLTLAGAGLLIAGLSVSVVPFTLGMVLVATGMALFTPNLGASISAGSANPARGIASAMSAIFAVQAVFPFVAGKLGAAFGPASVFLVLGAASLGLALLFLLAAGRGADMR